MYSKEIKCPVCDRPVHEWKAYHTNDGKHMICSTCYHAPQEYYETPGENIQDYKLAVKYLNDLKRFKNSYILFLKKAATYLNDKQYFKFVNSDEEEMSLEIFERERYMLNGEQELQIMQQLLTEIKSAVPPEDMDKIEKTVPSLFHEDHRRYYKYL